MYAPAQAAIAAIPVCYYTPRGVQRPTQVVHRTISESCRRLFAEFLPNSDELGAENPTNLSKVRVDTLLLRPTPPAQTRASKMFSVPACTHASSPALAGARRSNLDLINAPAHVGSDCYCRTCTACREDVSERKLDLRAPHGAPQAPLLPRSLSFPPPRRLVCALVEPIKLKNRLAGRPRTTRDSPSRSSNTSGSAAAAVCQWLLRAAAGAVRLAAARPSPPTLMIIHSGGIHR